jgi:plastocyanin
MIQYTCSPGDFHIFHSELPRPGIARATLQRLYSPHNKEAAFMRTHLAALAVLTASLGLFSPACSDDDSTGPPDDGGTFNGTIRVLDNRFSPASVTIAAGDSVTWRWEGSNFHTVTHGTNPTTPAVKLFDSSPAKASGTFGYRFDDPGTYPYYCDPHRTMGMTGTVTVQ